ncbi:MAG TPA: D-alanyl-D-alanine carboxypeptidase [Frankiaceae bacterium]|nr:D-alanyl-D-alanine carboxypeptidase [Frankiaceae bacterium]
MGWAGLRMRAAVVAVAAATAFTGPIAAAETPDVVGGGRLGSKGTVSGRGTPKLPPVSAQGWLLADADTGAVLAARNAHGRFLPASTMKMLTAVTLLPELDLSARYAATEADANIEGSKVGIVAGERYRLDKLMEAMLVVSGNDSAHALAAANGGMAKTVRQMNATAKRLQAYDTAARNTSGLDAPGQLTSPYDLALIAREGLRMPQFRKYSVQLRGYMPAPGGKRFEIYNHNKLLTRYPGAIGVKTGYTLKARQTYVGAARRGGRTLIVTLLKSETLYPDAIALLDWGFKAGAAAAPVGRLVDPVPADQPAEERADRSRTVPIAAPPAEVPVIRSPGGRSGRGYVPLAGGLAAAGGLVLLRRRSLRRRRGYVGNGTAPRLNLPIR